MTRAWFTVPYQVLRDAPSISEQSGVYVVHARLDALGEDDALMSLLTRREVERLTAIPLARRRREHVASRVWAKLLFLARHDGEVIDERLGPPIDRFSPESYRDLELARLGAGGPPRLFRRGVECRDLHVSIAHAAGCVVVGMSVRGPIGIDVATIEDHVSSFYRVQFSPRERAWASTEKRMLHTLLWTLKESIVKTGVVPHVTLWGYDEIEVLVDEPSAAVAASCERQGVLAPLHLTVPRLDGARVREAGFARISNSLLSFVAVELAA